MSGQSTNQGNRVGITFIQALTILFIALKLCGVIEWSWWWVLSPLWGAALAVFLFVTLITLAAVLSDARKISK